jgi:hypothetical protein
MLYITAEPFAYPRRDWPPSVRMVGPGIWDVPVESPAWLEEFKRTLVLLTCSSGLQNDIKLVRAALERGVDWRLTRSLGAATMPPAPHPRGRPRARQLLGVHRFAFAQVISHRATTALSDSTVIKPRNAYRNARETVVL